MSKYFSLLFGNEPTKERLGKAIKCGTMPHAFLISGHEGSGKRTLVKEICAALNCESDDKDSIPCHKCNNCRRIAESNFTDIKYLKKPDDKATIGVGEVRLFREDMFLSSTESEYKLYVILDAEKMTVNAQNALLKVLEEPPSGVVIFLLTSSTDGILTTIKSRTQHIAMQKFESRDIEAYLRRGGLVPSMLQSEELTAVLMCADGRIGKAKELIENGGKDATKMRSIVEPVVYSLKEGIPYSKLYPAIHSLPTKKDELAEALEMLTVAIRDLILVKFSEKAPLLFFASRDTALEEAEKISSQRLLAVYDVINDARDSLLSNANAQATLANLGARIKLI